VPKEAMELLEIHRGGTGEGVDVSPEVPLSWWSLLSWPIVGCSELLMAGGADHLAEIRGDFAG